ncbi:MAG: hypothetical protein FWC06_09145 [Treponema sp.]|nr:hypothetical protein [Treponema sp.]
MMKKILDGTSNDLELATAAHNGDQSAMTILWKKYRRKMMGIIGKYNHALYRLTDDELESEAAELFMHKLMIVFNPDKVKKSSDEWRFDYMLTGGSRNLRDKIIIEFRNKLTRMNEYDESDEITNSTDARLKTTTIQEALEWDDRDYTKYDPENTAIDNNWDPTLTVQKIEKKLSPFQNAILELKRLGMTVQQIADHMGCGFTTVRLHIVDAKKVAAKLLEQERCFPSHVYLRSSTSRNHSAF